MKNLFDIDVLIFIAVIIANIFAAVMKIKKDKKKREYLPAPDTKLPEDEIFAEMSKQFEQIQETFQREKNMPAAPPAPAAKKSPDPPISPKPSEPVEKTEKDVSDFDYVNFIREHGKEAFILAEMVLPRNSRRSLLPGMKSKQK